MRTRYRNYVTLQVLGIALVMLIFRVILDRKIASLFAASIFISLPLVIALIEYKKGTFKSLSSLVGLAFWACLAMPIFLSRVIFWDQEFAAIQIFGMPVSALHGVSNTVYLFWIAVTFFEHWKTKRRLNQPPSLK